MNPKILHVDIDRCIACHACESACRRENNGISHIFVTPINDKYSIPLSCLHCEKSPCVDVCPTNALEKTSYSAVTFQKLRCIGCGLCTIVCPFGVIRIDEDNTVLKCDKCIHRLKKGNDPVCVLTCPTKALIYGKRDQIMERKRKKHASGVKKAKKSKKRHA